MRELEAAFLFADLSGFSALTEAHGDLDAAEVADRFREMAEVSLRDDARIVKTIGDEVMIVSRDAVTAARTALELARHVDEEPRFLGVRAGLHRGAAVERSGDYFGAAVNLAARVSAHARLGQLLCTDGVAHSLRAAKEFSLLPAGVARFKNLAEPCELFEFVDPRRVDVSLETDPVCRMRLDPAAAAGRFRYGGRDWYLCSLECARAFTEAPDRYVGA